MHQRVQLQLQRTVQEGVPYESLPQALRKAAPYPEWQELVKAVYIHKSWQWSNLACMACSEVDYYESLLRQFRHKQRLFPYHLAAAVCGKLRVTPFKYYYDVVFQAMRNEMPYDKIPNFTAAEILQLLGIGRNEYIAKLNACGERKLLWRVNRSIAKEYLPNEPVQCKTLGWWRIQAVSISAPLQNDIVTCLRVLSAAHALVQHRTCLSQSKLHHLDAIVLACICVGLQQLDRLVRSGEKEFRELTREEEALLRAAEATPGGVPVSDYSTDVVAGLYSRHLIYLEVPLTPQQRFSTSSLEGFVSNRDLVAGDSDPMEALLYEVFVSNSERLQLSELAEVLGKPLAQVQQAMSNAVRMGFAVLIEGPLEDVQDSSDTTSFETLGKQQEKAIAIVLDAEATSFLMMGSLSPGMKKHSVTLFEGGRLAGKSVIEGLREELWSSVKAGAAFEGEMAHIVGVLKSLGTIVDTACYAEQGHPVEVVRKESLDMLAHAAATRMLQHAYSAIIAIDPLPGPPLPLALSAANTPALFGAPPVVHSPWLLLKLMADARAGPVSLCFTCGQRVSSMPAQAHGCTHALLWTWQREVWPAKDMGPQPVPHLIPSKFLLYVLNGLLSSTAVLMQPLWLSGDIPQPRQPFEKPGTSDDAANPLPVALLPLPLQAQRSKSTPGTVLCAGLRLQSQDDCSVQLPGSLPGALRKLGLDTAIGYLWAIPASTCCMPGSISRSRAGSLYVPYDVSFGAPLYNPSLCRQICGRVQEAGLLSADGIAKQCSCQQALLKQLHRFMCACGSNVGSALGIENEKGLVPLPSAKLLFDGDSLSNLQGWAHQQTRIAHSDGEDNPNLQ